MQQVVARFNRGANFLSLDHVLGVDQANLPSVVAALDLAFGTFAPIDIDDDATTVPVLAIDPDNRGPLRELPLFDIFDNI